MYISMYLCCKRQRNFQFGNVWQRRCERRGRERNIVGLPQAAWKAAAKQRHERSCYDVAWRGQRGMIATTLTDDRVVVATRMAHSITPTTHKHSSMCVCVCVWVVDALQKLLRHCSLVSVSVAHRTVCHMDNGCKQPAGGRVTASAIG